MKKTNTLAIVGFIFAFFVPIVGLVCSIIGYNKAKKEDYDLQGLALAGMIISAISLIIAVICIGSCGCLVALATAY